MARSEQLEMVAGIAVGNVRKCGLELNENDFIEIAAILTWRAHVDGNSEGQANVKTDSWPKVSKSWQGKYRTLVRKNLANGSTS